ncbi:class I SAM-dependent methyltransferase [Actinoplanes sp. LDG1-06]|uniref:Class I SAM-dependent methyltransferase n=1 Tax=Paractinoplanes ovalisporus TaxID=2810368 RepID=A0ABS2ALM5_9ACTN|nr:class I SAM-dependent methyltransferase [Actinoplanes ovalisporus]MBM2620121.1 class I SAM-dependent methyltransferase [Actinoplanes ovalisporus]
MTVNTCRICGSAVRPCLDLGRQPVSNAFPRPADAGAETFFQLAVGVCTGCTMVQQLDVLGAEHMFTPDYPYRSSTSAGLRGHFAEVAQWLRETELTGPDPLVVEIGSNDGVMLRSLARAGIRHLGVDPCVGAGETAARDGVRVRVGFFDERSAAVIRAGEGPAQVIFGANTISHVGDLGSIFHGAVRLLADDGVLVIEDRYLGDILAHTKFDQIYDEHVYLFAIRSVRAAAHTYGLELVDTEPLDMHGGAMRFVVARPGRRTPTARLARMLAEEDRMGLASPAVFDRFRAGLETIAKDLVGLLTDLRAGGSTVAGYGATSKSATVTNYCGIGPGLVPLVYDSTPEKQGRVTPGMHIPIVDAARFAEPYPDYALLFAWNHADEIIGRERAFRESGGRWILYVPDVHLV